VIKDSVVKSVRFQQGACSHLNSPFYAGILAAALADAKIDRPFWRVLDEWEGNPMTALTPLRLLGALHHLVLDGRAPELAAHFPSAGGDGNAEAAYRVANRVVRDEAAFVTERLDDEIQTNEVRRCAALLPGFLVVAQRAGLPMRLAELGASAGLNLCWDRYHYRLGDMSWGDEDAPLHLETTWSGAPPPSGRPLIASRSGCDISPLDISKPDDRTRLRSFVWPDQTARIELLDRAIDAASRLSPSIEKMSAGDFVDRVLGERSDGHVTVIYHSIMWLYVPSDERERIRAAIEAAGAEASADSPLAWMRMEFDDDKKAIIWLDYWPGNSPTHQTEKLGECHYHGTSVRWAPAT